MNTVLSLLGLVGPISIVAALIVLALLSQRLGAVTKRAPLYRWILLGAGLVGLSVVGRALGLFVDVPPTTRHYIALTNDLLFLIGLGIALFIVWRYWNWLLSERNTDTRRR